MRPATAATTHDAAGTEAEAGPGLHVFFFLCAALVVGFLAWAAVGRLDVVSVAGGEVVPSSQVKQVQHLEGGIVRDILVREGDEVDAGQPLVALEPTATGADVEELAVRMTSLEADVARLAAEAGGLDAPDFPEALVREHPDLVAQVRRLFDTRRSRIENRKAAQAETVVQREREIDEIATRLDASRRRLRLIDEQIAISDDLLRDDLTNRMLHLNLLKEQADLEGRISEDTAALARARAALNAARLQLRTIEDTYQQEVRETLEDSRRQLQEYRNRMRKYEDSLQRTVLRSPVSGVVKTLYVRTVGGVVKPGGTVADVVPGGDRLIIEARLPTQDVGYIAPGQAATIRLASSDAVRFGPLSGTVESISPDAIEGPDGRAYYRVRITTAADRFEHGGAVYRLVPGVRVMCSILTDERTVLEYLLDPFLRSAQTAFRER